MTTTDLVKQLFVSFNEKDNDAFVQAAREYIEHEKRKKHSAVAKDLEKALFLTNTTQMGADDLKMLCRYLEIQRKGFHYWKFNILILVLMRSSSPVI